MTKIQASPTAFSHIVQIASQHAFLAILMHSPQCSGRCVTSVELPIAGFIQILGIHSKSILLLQTSLNLTLGVLLGETGRGSYSQSQSSYKALKFASPDLFLTMILNKLIKVKDLGKSCLRTQVLPGALFLFSL